MNGNHNFHPQAPAFARSRPDAYYAWLTSNGFPHRVAYDQTTSIFGAPKSQEEIEREKAKQQQQAGFAQVGGAIAGTLGSAYVMNNAGEWIDKLTGTKAPAEVAAQLSGPSVSATPATQTAWNAGADAATTAPISGEMTAVQTPTGVQQVPTEMANDAGFLNSVNWGNVAQGAAGAAQLYQAYQAYKNKDYAGAGIQGLGGGLSVASSGALGTGAQTAAGEALGGYLVPGAQILAGGYGAYQTAKATGAMAEGKQRDISAGVGGGLSGLALGAGAAGLAAAAGASVGSVVPVVGTIIGAAAGYLASRYAGSSKDKGQMRRDSVRSALQERGILNENWQGTLADGSTADFGQDGSKLSTKAMNKLRSENPTAYDSAVELGDALSASYGFVGDNGRSLARLYVKGALSNAKDDPNTAIANMQHFAQQQGITFDLIKGNLDEALNSGRIKEGEYNRLLGNAQQLVGTPMQAPPEAAPIPRPEKGQVARQSAGLYRDDKGNLVRAKSMKQALRKAYDKTKEKEKK